MSTDISRRRAAALVALLPLAACGGAAVAAETAAPPLPRVALFTTGGTIQSKGDHRQKLMEYNAGRVTPQEFAQRLDAVIPPPPPRAAGRTGFPVQAPAAASQAAATAGIGLNPPANPPPA